jgi:long-chain acyl-CoA synthetase
VYEKVAPAKLALLLKIPLVRRLIARKILRGLGLDQVRFAGSGSAPMPADLIAWYRALGLELLEGYGMTENFNYSHLTRPGQVRPGYVGTPYDEVEFRLGDDGEVLTKSPGAMMGYYKLPDESRDAFTDDGFLHTGDRGVVDEQGRLKLTGRTKEIFKTSKGKYVAPVPIENRLTNHPRIEQCCVVGAGHPQPHAVVVLSDAARAAVGRGERALVERELAEHLEAVNATLDPHERLAFLAVAGEPWAPENELLTPTMKIRRRQIEQRYGRFADGWYEGGGRVLWES